MELTPQLLETQQFPEKWRGYDQDAVDEFLERVGVAVAELQDRLRSTAERIVELEAVDSSAKTVVSTTSPNTGTASANVSATAAAATSNTQATTSTDADAAQIGRALILAQAAADAAITEAKADAALIIKTANEKSNTVTGEARAKATTIESTAIQNADRLTAEANRRHAEATNKLDDADAHVARLAQKTVASAQAEAETLVAQARSDADELRAKAAGTAAAEAAQAIVAARSELTELELTRAAKQAEVSALSNELAGRQEALAGVVGDLESLLGRVGSLGGSAMATTPAEQPVATNQPAEAPEPASPIATREPEPSMSSVAAPSPSLDQRSDQPSSAPAAPASEPSRTVTGTAATMSTDDENVDSDEEPSAIATLVDDNVSSTADPELAPEPITPAAATATPATATEPVETEAASEVIDLTDSAVAAQDELKDLWAGIAAPASVGSGSAVVDDPFLAALRGPDRVEFDGSGEPDDDRSGFRRRRRTRRL